MNRGDIKNQPDKSKDYYYDQKIFDNPQVGPNMHQVNEGLIMPLTMDGSSDAPSFMPGLSYALMQNYAAGGLPCDLFISHAWDEGVFELIDNALKAWPEGCRGAYICCLSNPQNLKAYSAEWLGSTVETSPFHRILCSGTVSNFVMLANSNTHPSGSKHACLGGFPLVAAT